MKSGYDQFFKAARKVQDRPTSKEETTKRVSSQDVTRQLRERTRLRKRKKSAGVPWRLAGLSFVGLALTLVGLQNQEKIELYLKKVEISFFGKAIAEESKAESSKASSAKEAPKEAKDAKTSKEATEAKDMKEVKREYGPEEIDHFSKLNERKKELDAREAELARIETELQAQKAELAKRLQELEETRTSISKVLEDRVQADDKKVETLVQVYSNMKPQQAAKVFESMDEDLAVEILGRMKKKNAAEIMNLVKAEKAQVFSEKYAGYKRK